MDALNEDEATAEIPNEAAFHTPEKAQQIPKFYIRINGLSRWPGSDALTCWNHNKGASTVDYLIGSTTLIPDVHNFMISGRPFGLAADHVILTLTIFCGQMRDATPCFPRHPRYHFTEDTSHIYSEKVRDTLSTLDLSAPLEECTKGLADILHASATFAFPCTLPSSRPSCSTVPQNGWYDQECKTVHTQLEKEVATGARTRSQAMTLKRRMVRKKKRAYLAKLEEVYYQMFLGRDSKRAWQMMHERQPPIQITSPDAWLEYGRHLYDVLGQSPIGPPNAHRPAQCSFFTWRMVRDAIYRLQNGKAQDRDGLMGEHFSHACDVLTPTLASMFNRAVCEGFPKSWSDNTIVPLFKKGDLQIPSNYRTIMIGHTLAKIYGSILEHRISTWAAMHGKRSQGQAGFRRGYTTLDHILTLRTIIEEGRA